MSKFDDHTNLIYNVLYRHKIWTSHNSFDDCYQAGSLGLLHAIKTWRRKKGIFSSYAYCWIRRMVQDELAKQPVVRIGTYETMLRNMHKKGCLSIYAPYATNGRLKSEYEDSHLSVNDNCRLIDFLIDRKNDRDHTKDKLDVLAKAIELTSLTKLEEEEIRRRVFIGRPDGNTQEGKRRNGIFYYALKKIKRTIRKNKITIE